MKPCVRCHRHVRRAAAACPFCGTTLLDTLAPPVAWALGLAMLTACGGDKTGDDSTSSTGLTGGGPSSSGDADSTTTTGTPTTSGSDSTDANTTSGCGTACTDTSEATGFIYGAPDMGSALDCSIEAEDCPAGEKCMPWVEGGGFQWNALKCVPVDPNPAAPGEACVGNGLDGVDNCDKHVMCFEVSNGTGVCRAMCDAGACPPDFGCLNANDGVLQLCLPSCDLQAPACEPGHACIPVASGGVCAPG